MPKIYTDILSASVKYMTYVAGFFVKSFGGCYGSTVLMGASCWPSSHCIPAQTSVTVSGELNHDRSTLVSDSDNGVCCSLSLYQGSPHYGPRAKSDLRSRFTQPQNTIC